MSDSNGENYEIRPAFDNPLLQMMDPQGETAEMVHGLMEQMTAAGMDALTSDMTTEEVGRELLNSARWSVTLHYPTRTAEFLELFENLGINQEQYPELQSEHRYIRVIMLCQQINGDRLARLTVVEPIIQEEREAVGRQQRLSDMLKKLAQHGHVPAFEEWMDINFGDLSKHTPDEDRYDPSPNDNQHETRREFVSLMHDVQMSAIGHGYDTPDPFILIELIDLVEAFCARDPSHTLSLELLSSLRRRFDFDEYEELQLQQRTEQLYRDALVTFLRARIPKLEGGLAPNKTERNALRDLVDIGWGEPGYRSRVDEVIDELRRLGSFSEIDEAKISSWKADFVRKARNKGKPKLTYSWSDHTQVPSRY